MLQRVTYEYVSILAAAGHSLTFVHTEKSESLTQERSFMAYLIVMAASVGEDQEPSA